MESVSHLDNGLYASSGFNSAVGVELVSGLNSTLFCSGTIQVRPGLQPRSEESVY